MPVYEYACMSCEQHFEELVAMDAEAPPCPHCGAGDVLRQLSVFAAHGLSDPGAGSRAAGGGCCGGSCCQ